jgi:hypothetical protein
MKRTPFTWLLVVVSVTLLSIACKGGETSSGGAANSALSGSSSNGNASNSNRATPPQAGNDNAAPGPAVSSTEKKADESPELVGTYEAREILDKGVVTLVSKIKTTWWFSPDQTYSRVSQVGGNTYHSDSGTFQIAKPDRLLLAIQFSRERSTPKIHNPPLRRTHSFSLSPDGEELRLTSGKGSVAVFRRISKTRIQP